MLCEKGNACRGAKEGTRLTSWHPWENAVNALGLQKRAATAAKFDGKFAFNLHFAVQVEVEVEAKVRCP
jgi:hypothetical protein